LTFRTLSGSGMLDNAEVVHQNFKAGTATGEAVGGAVAGGFADCAIHQRKVRAPQGSALGNAQSP
jgi:hypothetical protein